MSNIILGIESSCDDTSAAVIRDGILLSNVIASQSVHEAFGGVVPELASRAHQQNIVPVVSEAIKRAGISKSDISAIAFTAGPGLIGSLLVGTSFAKGLATALDIPMVCVNHLHGHVLSHFIKEDESTEVPEFPYMCLLISGGNSQIIIVKDYNDMEILGQTIDDAAGEAFDKCAKVMGLPYPGGPHIDRLAAEGDATRFKFSKPHIPGLDYSFSGLKTSFLYTLRDEVKKDPDFIEKNKADLAASLQKTIIDILIDKLGKAVKEHPDLVQKYMGSVVGYRDNFFAALNSAVFSDGSFVYIPKGVRCPMELSTYFRINAANTGQFERTLIVADDDSYVSYLEGCTAPQRDENQLHAAIVEIVVHDRAEVKYSTVQNWYPGDAEGKGGIYNFVTKRGHCKGVDSKLSWTQVETGSAITWKYPSCILSGDNSTAEFYSVAVTNNYQQADTGTKMIHLGKNTRSTIVSKGISAGKSQNSYRGLVRVAEKAENARNYSQCDSLLLGSNCGAHTFPYMDIHNETAVVEHEATTSKISEDQLFYCNQRGIPTEDAIGLIVNGYAKEVINKLPMEFAVEAQKLLAISLEGSVG